MSFFFFLLLIVAVMAGGIICMVLAVHFERFEKYFGPAYVAVMAGAALAVLVVMARLFAAALRGGF